jgi:hypothetical protein
MMRHIGIIAFSFSGKLWSIDRVIDFVVLDSLASVVHYRHESAVA